MFLLLFIVTTYVFVFGLIIIRPSLAIYFLLCICYFQVDRYIVRFANVLPRFFIWLPFFISGFIFIILLLQLIASKRINKLKIPVNSPLGYLLSFLLMIAVVAGISMVLNHVPVMTTLFGIRYFIMMGLFTIIFIFYNCPVLTILNFSRVICFLALLQMPVTLTQRLFIIFSELKYMGDIHDLVTGTFSTYPTLVFIQLLAMGLCCMYWMRTRKVLVGKSFILLVFGLYLPLLLSGSRASFLFVGLLGVVISYKFFHVVIRKLHYITILIFLLVIAFAVGYGKIHQHDYSRSLKEEYSWGNIINQGLFYQRYTSTGGGEIEELGRGTSIIFAWNLIKNQWTEMFFGLGSGNTQKSQSLGRSGKLYIKYQYVIFIRNQVARTLTEFGIAGIALIFYLFWGIRKSIKTTIVDSRPETIFLKDSFFILIVICLILSIYYPLLEEIPVVVTFAYFIATTNSMYCKKWREDPNCSVNIKNNQV